MLRVSYSESDAGQSWHLSGRLAGAWVDELRSCWQHQRERAPRAHAVVDLRDVTFIDEAGETLLAEMQKTGTEFVAAGVENTELIATLKDQGERALRRITEDVSAGCKQKVTVQGDK